MKRFLTLLMAVVLLMTFGLFALGSSESSEETTDNQGSSSAADETDKTNLGDYHIEIKSSRIAKDFEGKNVIIITYGFTNYSEDPASFDVSFEDTAFQDGIGLNKAYVLADSANYSSDNQSKEIKTDSSLDVEVAYELNDNTTPVDVEITEWISFNDDKVTKTFTIDK